MLNARRRERALLDPTPEAPIPREPRLQISPWFHSPRLPQHALRRRHHSRRRCLVSTLMGVKPWKMSETLADPTNHWFEARASREPLLSGLGRRSAAGLRPGQNFAVLEFSSRRIYSRPGRTSYPALPEPVADVDLPGHVSPGSRGWADAQGALRRSSETACDVLGGFDAGADAVVRGVGAELYQFQS